MKNTNTDQRVRVTKAMIRAAFIKLLNEKSIRSITVRELCDNAHINRATFYCHYLDIYDLKEQLENELLEELETAVIETIAKTQNPSDKSVFRTVFSLLKENSELCVILLSNNANANVIYRFSEKVKNLYNTYYKGMFPNASEEKLDRFYTFIASGCIALLRNWMLQNADIPPEEVADEANKIMTLGINYLK